ncbi:MAG: MMPL family transporter [Pseudomonadota bacterium]
MRQGGVQRGRWIIGIWLLSLVLAGWWISRTTFQADLSAFLPRNPDLQQQVLLEQIQSGTPARTLLIGIEGGSVTERAEASRKLAEGLRQSDLFEQVQNGDLSAWRPVGEWLLAHRYQLSPGVDAQRFTEAGLQAAFNETLSLLGTPAGSALKPLLSQDPTGEMQRIAEMLIPSQAPRSEQGVWMGRTHPRALLLVSTRAAGGDLDAQEAAIAKVRSLFAAQTPSSALSLQLSGAPVFAVNSRAQIQKEAHVFAAAGTVLMGLLLCLAFGSIRAVLTAFLPVATGVVCGIVAVSVAFGHVHGLTLGFGSTLIGESVDYAIYFLIQARPAAGTLKGEGWRQWLVDGWPTVRLGLLTSLCGFAALVWSGFPGLAQLGVFSLAGLIGAALTTRYVLPLFMPDGAKGQGARRLLATGAVALSRHLPRWRPVWLVLGVAALATLVWQTRGAQQTLWQGNLQSLNPISASAQALDAELRADLSGSDAGTLVILQSGDEQALLQATEAVSARLDTLVEQGQLAGFESPTRWLPSLATQASRLGSLPDADILRGRLQQATRGGPLEAQRLAPFVSAVEAARTQAPLTLASVREAPVAPLVHTMLWQQPDGRLTALLPLQEGPSGVRLDAVRQALAGLDGPAVRVQVLSIQAALDDLYAGYLQQAIWQVMFGAVGVVVLMALWLRHPRRLLRVCLPLAGAVILTLGGLWWSGVSLGVLHLVGLLLVVAVGSNYVLFFDALAHNPAMAHNEGMMASLLLANLTTVLSFGLLAFSKIPVLSALGMVVGPGALLAFFLAASFLPVRRTV